MSTLDLSALAVNVGLSVVLVAVLMAAVMALAIAVGNQSIVDPVWGPGFALVAVLSYVLSAGEGDDARRLVALVVVVVWGVRLGVHIGLRNRGKGEDPRYTEMLERQSGSDVGILVRRIYGIQGLAMVVISLPLQVAMYTDRGVDVLVVLGVAVWALGFVFETVGDWQLSRFKADPGNEGRIMDRGLWHYTRHPNYFGDACVWVGVFLLACGSWWGLLTVVSPVAMTFLLVRGTGAATLEKAMTKKRGQAYTDYVERTSGFVPWPPRRKSPTS